MTIYNKNNFKIYDCCSDDSRPAISGVLFTPDYSVATDSYCLVKVATPKLDINDYPVINNHNVAKYITPTIVPKETCKQVLKNIPNNNSFPIVNTAVVGANTNKETIEFLTTDLETSNPVMSRKIDEKYPQFQQIIPKHNKTKIMVNPEILIKVLKHFINSNHQVMLEIGDKHAPIKITGKTDQDQEILGLVMPLRQD